MKLSSQTFKHLTLSVLLLALGGVVGFQIGQGRHLPLVSNIPFIQQKFELINQDQPTKYGKVDFAQFWEVWSILENQYYDPTVLNPQKQVYGAIEGMTSALGDPYTLYLPPSDQKRSTQDLEGSFFGVGIQLGYIDKTLAVVAPLKGSPAEAVGVQAGDLILHIKDATKNVDQDTMDINILEAVDLIRGERNVPVSLTLYREGVDKPFDVDIKRDEIIVPSVELSYVEKDGKKAAVITLSRFGGRTDQEWSDAVTQITRQTGLSGVILDVRNNPGGFLDGAIDIASEFIKDGAVVSQQGKFNTQKYTVSKKGKLTDLPVDVLINKGSASASEIVAGALRDRRNAQLIGENSFGKGTVQDALELDNGAGLHVTVGKWLLPSGDWIHEKGLPANIEIKDDPETKDVDEVVMKALETL